MRVLHTNDTPHAIALGAGIATLVAFLPLMGIQTFIAIGLSALVRANKAICIPIVWITNPFTFVPIYTACWWVGRLLRPTSTGPGREAVLSSMHELQSMSLLEAEFWNSLLKTMMGLGKELWLGCLVVGIVGALLAYAFSRWGVISYRESRRQRMLKRNLRRSQNDMVNVVRRAE